MTRIIPVFLAFIFAACSSAPVPKGILPPAKMQKLVSEMVQADEYINTFLFKDSAIEIKKKRSVFYEKIFAMNNTTRKEFYSSFAYYEQHPDIQKALFDSLYEQVNRQKIDKYKSKPVRNTTLKP